MDNSLLAVKGINHKYIVVGDDNIAKTVSINVRIDPKVKKNAEQLFSSFEITVTDAINMFLMKSSIEGGLPFEVKQARYNVDTETAMQEAKDIMNGKIQTKEYNSAKEL